MDGKSILRPPVEAREPTADEQLQRRVQQKIDATYGTHQVFKAVIPAKSYLEMRDIATQASDWKVKFEEAKAINVRIVEENKELRARLPTGDPLATTKERRQRKPDYEKFSHFFPSFSPCSDGHELKRRVQAQIERVYGRFQPSQVFIPVKNYLELRDQAGQTIAWKSKYDEVLLQNGALTVENKDLKSRTEELALDALLDLIPESLDDPEETMDPFGTVDHVGCDVAVEDESNAGNGDDDVYENRYQHDNKREEYRLWRKTSEGRAKKKLKKNKAKEAARKIAKEAQQEKDKAV